MGPDDRITVDAIGAPEIAGREYRIDPGGEVRLPMIGSVGAEGRTPAEVEEEIRARLDRYIRDPQVSVAVSTFGSRPVSVLGQVAQPGVHQIEGGRTLRETLSQAGGLKDDAGVILTLTRRAEQGKPELPDAALDASGRFWVAHTDLRALADGHAPALDILVAPHDVLSVPRAEQAYVIGAVQQPGAFSLQAREGMTVLEALAQAGGLAKHADTKGARILRSDGAGGRSERAVDVKAILAGASEDVRMEPDDVLFIPIHGGKAAAAQLGKAAINIGTGAAIWTVAR
ncbi:MAG: polysaccharide biosynthesis/export family protein [Bryobacterales bacterium]|nr:polysaccharide biosynthesis/export family protein [Bryobacterales bacterium]